jgi:hypothetical protein
MSFCYYSWSCRQENDGLDDLQGFIDGYEQTILEAWAEEEELSPEEIEQLDIDDVPTEFIERLKEELEEVYG